MRALCLTDNGTKGKRMGEEQKTEPGRERTVIDWPVVGGVLVVFCLLLGWAALQDQAGPADKGAPVAGAQPQVRIAIPTAPPERARRTFHGIPCTDDCSGHEAGAEWAQAHDLTDPDHCTGNSQSFIEGCMETVLQRLEDDPTLR